jgi:hypothetical protein
MALAQAEAPTPTVEEYMAAGQTRENAEQLVAADADCARRKAKLASLIAKQRERLERLHQRRIAEFARLTAARRAGLRPGEAFDFEREWAEAHRHAVESLRGPRSRGAGRPASRPGGTRTTASSSSARGDPDLGDEPPGHRAGRLETPEAILTWVAERARTLAALVAGWTA